MREPSSVRSARTVSSWEMPVFHGSSAFPKAAKLLQRPDLSASVARMDQRQDSYPRGPRSQHIIRTS